MPHTRFAAVSYPVRLYSGIDALENLTGVLDRAGAKRAYVVCGRSVSRKTDLIARICGIAGERFAGLYDEMLKDAPLECIQAAVEGARGAKADLLVAVGAGSVIKAVRIVAILLAEKKPVEDLITRYPPTGPAVSPRLLAPKLPIVNVLTAPTTAQNRAGAAAKKPEAGHRLEFFDPKTRPVAIFWDSHALLSAPPSLALTTSASVFWRSLMNIGNVRTANPLVEGERHQAFRLAHRSLPRVTDPTDADARIELCAAAFLQNREEDAGRTLGDSHWVARMVYALTASVINICEAAGQGDSYAILTGPAVRHVGARNMDDMVAVGRALGVEAPQPTPAQVAEAIDGFFRKTGLSPRLRDLGVPRESLPAIVDFSLKNFNADRERAFLNETETLTRILEDAW